MDFDVDTLRRADRIIAGGAIALFILMFFFKWYGVSANVSTPVGIVHVRGGSVNAWHGLTNIRWLLLLTIICAAAMLYLLSSAEGLKNAIPISVILTALGALSTILIVYRTIIDHPGGSAVSVKLGAYLAIVAAGAITYGAYLAMQEEGASLADVRDQAGRAVGNVTQPAGTSAPMPPPAAPAEPAPAPPPVPPVQ
jgi:hypothetical protein